MMSDPTTQSGGNTIKVYELAKELGTDSLSLLDRLASLNIKVKNHMSDLGEEEVRTARESFKAATSAKKDAPKKTVTRKKKADAVEEVTLGAAPTKAATKTVTKTTATPAKTRTKAAAEKAAPSAPAPAATAASSAVLRRRVKSEGGEATSTVVSGKLSPPPPTPVVEEEAAPAIEETSQSYFEEVAAQDTMEVEAAPQAAESPAQTAVTEATAPMDTTASAKAAPAAPAAKKSFLNIAQPKEMIKPRIISHAPPAPKPSAPTPRGTGPTPQGGVRGATTQDKDGFRVIRMTKENLDQMAEEENQKKRGGGGGREIGEIKPEDVKFNDYRKKEIVFLPKRKKIPVGRELKRTEITQSAAHKRVVQMDTTITVADFAHQMNVKATDVIRKLMGMGMMASMNQAIDFDTASVIAPEFQYEVKNIAFQEAAVLEAGEDKPESLKPRPPVVTIMGHVDHGKTSLLDAIRSANVAGGEAGGITQHIGAYTVEKSGKLISFIDTPGHEAFTAMRARGANVTDIVILVVAADDGVMPQTREALSHAKAAGVPIIVAMNKMDKPGANPEKIKQQLAELDLLAEDWGGQSQFVPVSAAKKTGLEDLLEAVLLNAEVLDLKANPDAPASGTVLEARLEKGRGPVASILVKRGTIRVGDYITSGQMYGRVKSLMNDKGGNVKECTPGMPVEVLGFDGLPLAGEKFDCVDNDQAARELVTHRRDKALSEKAATQKVTLEDLFARSQAGTMKELNVILKADVAGSVEAVRDSLLKLATEKVKVKVVLAAPGGITESDILLATASKALIIGFNVRPETTARRLAEAEHIEIRTYSIIYELLDDVKLAMAGILDKKKVEKFLGRAEVRQTFTVPKLGTVAGCAVIDGKIQRGANVRLLRDSRVIFDGKLSSLKRFKDDAKEVAEGYECGMGIENYNDIKIGDLIEAYTIEMITPELTG